MALALSTAGVRLGDVLPDAHLPPGELRVTSCCADSRHVRPGDLFVALVGASEDGHDYVAEAIAAGASAVLAERMLPTGEVPLVLARDTRDAYGRLCQALAGDPSKNLRVIGVTGTNGKTTTSLLIASILKRAGGRVGVLGTLGYCDTVDAVDAPLTTPPAPVVADWLGRMVAAGCTHAVMEVSSHALCQGRVAGIDYDAAIVTNVRRDHLDYHGSIQNYRAAKARLFEQLVAEGLTVINADDPASVQFLPKLEGPVLTVAIDRPAEITATPLEQHASEQTFLLTAGDDTLPVRTTMIGRHHIYNCLSAAALGLAFGIDLPSVVRGLETVDFVPGRLERIECGQPYSVFVDYAHTPDALAEVLSALRPVTAGRLICVFGAGGDRDRLKRPLMGRVVEAGADLAVVTSDNPRRESPRQITENILAGFDAADRAVVLEDRLEAIHWALAQARPGDCVLIAGKGHENYQIVGRRRYEFDDRRVARDWLYQHAPKPESFGSKAA